MTLLDTLYFKNRNAVITLALIICIIPNVAECSTSELIINEPVTLPDARRFEEAATYLNEAAIRADKGDGDAAYLVGLAYFYGDGVKEDKGTALQYFKRAAQLRHEQAAINVAHMFNHGLGVAKDPTAAFAYYMLAANMGSGDASYHGALLLQAGKTSLGVKDDQYADLRKAYELMKFAVSKNINGSHFHLASMMEYGTDKEPANYEQADALYKYCCAEGDVDCCYHRALMYSFGRPTFEANPLHGLLLFQEAFAKFKHGPSAYYLGVIHERGEIVEKNLEVASYFYEQALKSESPFIAAEAQEAIRRFVTAVEYKDDHVQAVLHDLRQALIEGRVDSRGKVTLSTSDRRQTDAHFKHAAQEKYPRSTPQYASNPEREESSSIDGTV